MPHSIDSTIGARASAAPLTHASALPLSAARCRCSALSGAEAGDALVPRERFALLCFAAVNLV